MFNWTACLFRLIFLFSCDETAPPQPRPSPSSIFQIAHTYFDSSVRVISSSQRPVPTQQKQETNIHALSGSRTHDPSNQAILDCTATSFGCWLTWHIYLVCRLMSYLNPNEVMNVVNFGLCVVTPCVYPTLSLRCFTTPKIVWILTAAVNLSCLR